MEQKKINIESDNGTPTADLVIKAPIELRSLCVAVGTKITIQGFTYLCVEQVESIPIWGDGEHTHVLCAGCDASWNLCHIMICEAGQRPDGRDVQFKVIACHKKLNSYHHEKNPRKRSPHLG